MTEITEDGLIEKMLEAFCAMQHPDVPSEECMSAALSALPIPLSDLLAVVNGKSVIMPVASTGMARVLEDQLERDRFPKIEARPK